VWWKKLHLIQEGKKFTALEVPTQCPLILLVKVSWRKSRALGSEEDKVFVSGVLA
jgi:hypothetical protein